MLATPALLVAFALPLTRAKIVETSTPISFSWKANFTDDEVPQCGSIGFSFSYVGPEPTPANYSGSQPLDPFTLNAYPAGGVPISTTVKPADQGGAVWPVGIIGDTQFMMSLYDSGGSQGGVQGVFKVQSPTSTDANCTLPTSSENDFKVLSNDTDPNVCDPVAFLITGGMMPYNLTFVVEDDKEYTAMMGSDDDEYIWIANGAPDKSVIVSAMDSMGRLAISTGLIKIQNSTATASDCPGKQSFSRQTPVEPVAEPTSASTRKRVHVGSIIGESIGALVFVGLLGFLIMRCCCRRPRNRGQPPLNREAQETGDSSKGGAEETMIQVAKPGSAVLPAQNGDGLSRVVTRAPPRS